MRAEGLTVLIMAGGTGGHVFPALAVAEALAEQGVRVHWLGTDRGIEARLVPARDIPLHLLPVAGIRGKGLAGRVGGLARAVQALFVALALIRRLKPACVLGMGGYVAGPGGLAAWLLRVPLVIHEQNAVAGTTNRLLARFAREVLTGYPIALGGARTHFIGNPVRADIAGLAPPGERWRDRGGPLRLLVLGGSQGALAINTVVVEAVIRADALALSVWHQTGAAHIEGIAERYREAGVDVRAEAFVEDMAAAYGWADIVLCRAGALTVAELVAAGVGAWLVPLPQAIDDHQRANARWLVDNGAGEILEQNQLSADSLLEKLRRFVDRREELLVMARHARALARPEAARVAASHCLEVAHGQC